MVRSSTGKRTNCEVPEQIDHLDCRCAVVLIYIVWWKEVKKRLNEAQLDTVMRYDIEFAMNDDIGQYYNHIKDNRPKRG